MKKIKPLIYEELRKTLDPADLHFKTTGSIKSVTHFIGQARAREALIFGISIKHHGYNIYAMGPSGIGKYSFINILLKKKAKHMPTPADWCYIHNFDSPETPIALQLPHGKGAALQRDMKNLIEEVGSHILSVIESDVFHQTMKKINGDDNALKTPSICKKQHDKALKLQIKLIRKLITPLIEKIKHKYKLFPAVQKYLKEVQRDMLAHTNDFISQDEKTNLFSLTLENPVLAKYKINLFVNNKNHHGAPIIFEEAPSYSSIICRIEHTAELGTLTTNFSLIRPGSLHLANGGFLIIEARKIRKNHEAWEALKSCLYAGKIMIKPMEHENDLVKPVSLNPMPIPLSLKVILIGDRNTYYSLCQKDPEFTELFKVAADFDEEINKDENNIERYAKLIATITRKRHLRPFHAKAVAAIMDYSSRLSEDNEKLSMYIRDIEDVMMEADYYASLSHVKVVDRSHIQHAIDAKIHRMDRSRELYYEEIRRHFLIIRTEGRQIGQINCLSVRKVGNYSYGHPTRVSARVRLGKGTLVDIQREIKLAGPFHSKAGLIIANFLAARFCANHPYALTASIAFEQLYCWTDGDSASAGELCALLSALAEVPLLQSFAITGSIDQYGKIQAVGGINEKIEGFFDICQARGFKQNQGVLIPAINRKNLMLREDIVNAVAEHQFTIYPIHHIDEAVELMTGMQAGECDTEGHYSLGSFYHKIEARLMKFALNQRKK